MSDFLFASRRRAPGELREVLWRYLAPVTAEIEEHHGGWGSLAVARAVHDAAPVRSDGAFLSVLVGDPIVRTPDGSRGPASTDERLRTAVHAALRDAPRRDWDERLDGPFAALGIDVATGEGLLVSDLAAFVPLFAAEAGGRAGAELVLGTHVDCVARAAGREGAIDRVSAADLVIHRTCTFPHTLYDGVEQHPPAVARGFRTDGGWTEPGAPYWEPFERIGFGSRAEAADALRAALIDDVRTVCAGRPAVGLLFSGGEDARAVLGAVPPETGVRAFVFADWENREVRVARAAARAYGAPLVFGRRHPDHYPRGLPDVAAMVGSGQIFMDVHGYGFHESLGIRDLPVVLGGLSSDAFLKASHEPTGDAARGHPLPHSTLIRADLRAAVVERRAAFRARLRGLRPRSAAEWERLWPFSMRQHAANFHGNRRLFASHEPFQSNAVVRLAAAVPQEWKRHGVLFHRAMRPLLARSWHVPHSRWRYPYFGRLANLPLTVGLRVARGVRAVATGEVRAKQGPWPKWGRVVRSAEVARLQREHPLGASPLLSLFDPADPDEVARAVRRDWHPLRELMLLQLVYLTSRDGRR